MPGTRPCCAGSTGCSFPCKRPLERYDRHVTLIDPAISDSLTAGYTLPADWYTDPEIARLERERIFGRSWQYVGPLEHLDGPQRRLSAELGERRVVVMREADGALRAGVGDPHGPAVAVD